MLLIPFPGRPYIARLRVYYLVLHVGMRVFLQRYMRCPLLGPLRAAYLIRFVYQVSYCTMRDAVRVPVGHRWAVAGTLPGTLTRHRVRIYLVNVEHMYKA